MSYKFKKILIAGLIIIAIATAGIFLRLYFKAATDIDKAESALKDDNGKYALELLEPWARIGDGDAQWLMALTYSLGIGGEKNDRAAIYWFKRCGKCKLDLPIEDGASPLAANELWVGRNYASGQQVEYKDEAEAVKWFKRAAAGGSREAIAELRNRGIPAPERMAN